MTVFGWLITGGAVVAAAAVVLTVYWRVCRDEREDHEREKRTEYVTQAVVESAHLVSALKQMSNAELANLLLEQVWADLYVWSPASDIVGEAIRRLQGEPTLDQVRNNSTQLVTKVDEDGEVC